MYLRCLKTLVIEISVMVFYLIAIVFQILFCVKFKWKEFHVIYLILCIFIMFITVAALFTQLSLILCKTRENKVFMIKYSFCRGAVVIIVNLVELIIILLAIDSINYPCKDEIKYYTCKDLNLNKDYYAGIINSDQINLVYRTFIYGACAGVVEILISVILYRRYQTLEPPFNPPSSQDEQNGQSGSNVVVTQTNTVNNIQQNLRTEKNEKK